MLRANGACKDWQDAQKMAEIFNDSLKLGERQNICITSEPVSPLTAPRRRGANLT